MNPILIAEDEPILARNLGTVLIRAGYPVQVVNSFRAGIEAVAQSRFSMICADINLGDGCGLALSKRAREAMPGVPIILMTGRDLGTYRQAAEAIHAAFLAKPFALSEFREIVSNQLPDALRV